MTYQNVVRSGEQYLAQHGIREAGTDAWLLLAAACGIDRNFYYLHSDEEMPDERRARYRDACKQRAQRIPLQYITGEQMFMGLRFLVNQDVLIPRQDTEILVEEALKVAEPGMELLDLCTGSGCIAISMLKHCPGIRAVASDISERALQVAGQNARLHEAKLQFVASDLFDQIYGTFDVIVSNPPYIPTGQIAELMEEVREFEPHCALDGSKDGLMFYRRILADARAHQKPGGYLLFEIGCDQAEAVSALMTQAGYGEIKVIKDLAGLDRVVIGKELENV